MKFQNSRPAIATNVAWNWISQTAEIGISLFLVRLLLMRLGQDSYGVWILVGSIVGYYQLMELGINSAIVRYLAQAATKKDDQAVLALFSSSLVISLCLSVVAVLISIALMSLPPQLFKIPAELSNQFRGVVFLSGATVAVSIAGNPFSSTLRALERFDTLNAIKIISNFAKLGLIYLLLDSSLITLAYIFLAAGVMVLVMMAVFSAIHLGTIPFSLASVTRPVLVTIFKFAGVSFIIIVADLIRFRTDAIVISAFIGVAPITLFYLGNRLLEYVRQITAQVSGPFIPRFSAQDSDGTTGDMSRTFVRASRLVAFLAAIALGCVAGAARPLLSLWVGETTLDLTQSYTVMLILLLPTFISVSQSISISLLYSTNRHKLLAILTASDAAANLALSIVLVKPLGIYGVALGTALPILVTKGCIQPWYVGRFLKLPLRKYAFDCLLCPGILLISLGAVQTMAQHFIIAQDMHIKLIVVGCGTLASIPASFFLYFNRSERLWIGRYAREWLKLT